MIRKLYLRYIEDPLLTWAINAPSEKAYGRRVNVVTGLIFAFVILAAIGLVYLGLWLIR